MTSASEAPEILLQHHLKKLRLPTVLRDYEKLARQCAADNVDHIRYLVDPEKPCIAVANRVGFCDGSGMSFELATTVYGYTEFSASLVQVRSQDTK